jgi:hypothetical protein
MSLPRRPRPGSAFGDVGGSRLPSNRQAPSCCAEPRRPTSAPATPTWTRLRVPCSAGPVERVCAVLCGPRDHASARAGRAGLGRSWQVRQRVSCPSASRLPTAGRPVIGTSVGGPPLTGFAGTSRAVALTSQERRPAASGWAYNATMRPITRERDFSLSRPLHGPTRGVQKRHATSEI